MLRRITSLAAVWLVAASCQLPPERSAACDVCLTADVCCAAHTANVESNCQLHATCQMYTGEKQATVADGCAYYLRVASTPPAPAACGPHPDAD